MPGGNWHLQFGDPDWFGWVVTAGYLAAALLCWRAGRVEASSLRHRDRLVWPLLAVALLALAINKQLDLQTLVTDMGRAWAREGGWYKQRRTFQREFIIALGIAAVAGVVGLRLMFRRSHRMIRVALTGFTLLVAFIVLRAASFHHFDVVLRAPVLGVKLRHLLEVAGIGLVGWAAWRRVKG